MRRSTLLCCLVAALGALVAWLCLRKSGTPTSDSLPPGTVEDRLKRFAPVVRARLAEDFSRARLAYPPSALTLVALKDEKILQLYAAGPDGAFRFVRSYPILAASGRLGPKLREGDRQVPEGLYRIESLNPNSRFHLSLRVNYPNAFDLEQAEREGRTEPGSDIMIHGRAVSIGCLAVGDPAAEDLFVLAALTGLPHIQLIISPVDFRTRPDPALPEDAPTWVPSLWRSIREALSRYPIPPSS